ncbi:camphor resistance protein CrcB [Clostridium novyi A str. 4570]|uniref:Fluoride-specific ion channel FluC n=1 Tax=Clostridium novyi A str. 4570 TaxID=1444290 RepID=A0AA89CNA5_CLONO|nr:fluoride efflux transporter CrcB [Clostridium novyi]KGN02147.1 camphor resistance protein CrcB [Clostridium novyi A str. 4570]
MEKLTLAIIVGCGGFIGAALRYLISENTSKMFNGNFPYGTLIVNIVGAIIIGFIMDVNSNTSLISAHAKLFLTTGMMGGLTTFSTFSYETINLISCGNILMGCTNAALNLGLSLVGVIIGQALGKIVY